MKQLPRLVYPLLATLFGIAGLFAEAQGPAPRLTGSLAGGSRATLAGSKSPHALAANDEGALPASTALGGISLVFKRSAAQETALQALLTAQQTPGSPQFHQWLTPEQFATQFGVADADLSTVETWLQAQGFTVDRVARSRDRILFSGTAGAVTSAFGTELHRYLVNGEQHFAPSSDLTLPAALEPMVATVNNLSDFRLKPQVKFLHGGPDLTSSQSSPQNHFLDPLDVATQYDVNSLYTAGFNGAGQSIAVLGQTYVNTADVTNFQRALGLASSTPQLILVPNSGTSGVFLGDEAESDLDLEYSSAMARGASILFVYSGANMNTGGVFDSLAYAVEQNIAPVLSFSYGECELDLSASALNGATQLTEQASAQGQTIIAAAGDDGSTTCSGDTTLNAIQQGSLAVSFPANLANVTGLGGLEMQSGTYTAGNTQYFAAAGSSDNLSSLLSYVPETVWNEDTEASALYSGGGGVSILVPRPSWQAGVPGITSGATRLVPDISLQASSDSPGYVFCTSDVSAYGNSQANSCSNGGLRDSATGDYTLAGGTSFAAPIFAGMVAVLNQYEHSIGQGNINPTLYGLAANTAAYAADFHDVTTGTNACPAGVSYCSTAGSTAYGAGVGYDEASGLGSVDFAKLVAAWPAGSSSALLPTSTQVSLTSSTLSASQQTTVSVTVNNLNQDNGVPATISGTAQVFVDNVAAGSVTLSSGTGQATVTTPAASGSHVVKVFFPGNTSYASSTGSAVFTIGSTLPSGTFTLTATPLTIGTNGTGSSTVTVIPAGGYGGVVNIAIAASSANICYALTQIDADPSTNQLQGGLNIGAGTACTSAAVRSGTGAWRMAKRSGTATVSRSSRPASPASPWPASVAFAGLLAGAWGLRRRQRGLLPFLALTLLVAAGFGLSGCGGSSSTLASGGGNGVGIGAQTVTVTVVGTDSVNSAITSSTTFTLTVN